MSFFQRIWHKIRTPFLGLTSTFAILVFLFVLMDWVVMPLYTKHGQEVELPDITYESFEDAKAILKNEGFQIVHDGDEYSAVYPESTVVFQKPSAYSQVKRGRRIYVTLSLGDRLIAVPKLIGSSERNAELLLQEASLKLGKVEYKYSNIFHKGVVSEQFPRDSMMVENSYVDVTVSIGRIPSHFYVPGVVGKSFESARELLWKAGLQVGQVTYVSHNKLVPDTVIEQSIAEGEEVEQGRPIDLKVSQLEE